AQITTQATRQDEIEVSSIPPTLYSSSVSLRKRSWSEIFDPVEELEGNEMIKEDLEDEMSEENSIWHLWNDNDIHNHSLERLNIIQLGNKIGSPTTQKYYTEELIDKTNIVVKSFPDYFDNSTDYHDSFFDQLDISQNDAKLFLLSKAMFAHESNCRFFNFSEEVYKTFTNEMFMNNDDVFIDEVNFNVRIIFPIIQSLVRNMDNMRFLPGETRLKAVSKELKLLSNDTTHYYSADGILSLRSSNLEIALLETTGKLNVEDRPKE
ncbi:hypothetical protein CU098_000307, partial [Rhizopus stolonifer]